MKRMRKDLSIQLLFDFWLGGIISQINLFLISDRTVIAPHERVVAGKIEPLVTLTGLDLSSALCLVKEEDVSTTEILVREFWSEQGEEVAPLIAQLSGLYDELMALIDETSGRYKVASDRHYVIAIRDAFVKEYEAFLRVFAD
ncbi:hypothetical protein GCM10011317_50010 [Niveispirillum cyanobacteriorum]|nr:hypothetical protein GCM10011317_50010 [Niveispirillum cyanobacteriorum]